MTSKHNSMRIVKSLLFLAPAVTLAYISLISHWEVAALAWLGLGLLYVFMRPFSASVKTISLLCVGYLVVGGVLTFAQPLALDAWPIFAIIVMISMALQPLIFLLAVDAVMRLLSSTHQVYDMAAVVLLWASTLAVTFGSTALLHGSTEPSFNLYLLFMIPWLMNGFVFYCCFCVLFGTGYAQKKTSKNTP